MMDGIFGELIFGEGSFGQSDLEFVLVWNEVCPIDNTFINELEAVNSWDDQPVNIGGWSYIDPNDAPIIRCRRE